MTDLQILALEKIQKDMAKMRLEFNSQLNETVKKGGDELNDIGVALYNEMVTRGL